MDNVKSMNQPKMNVQELYTVNILSDILGSTFVNMLSDILGSTFVNILSDMGTW